MESWGYWPSTGVRVEAPGWEARVFASSDNVEAVNTSAFSKACEGEVCLQYYVNCRPEMDQMRQCFFAILREGQKQPVEINITAYGVEREQAALRSISFVTENGVRIPLETMTARSLTESPYCKRVGRSDKGPIFEPACAYLNP
ncbi:MAG: hypothetical protein GC145_14030 [Caulobacter sp.]|nr:hypothetical protein [Caulobacter sp.]